MLKTLLDLPSKIPQDRLLHAFIGVLLAAAMARFPLGLAVALVDEVNLVI